MSILGVVGSGSGFTSSVVPVSTLVGVGLALLLEEGSDSGAGGSGCGICTGGATVGSGLIVSYRPVGVGVVSGFAMNTVNP